MAVDQPIPPQEASSPPKRPRGLEGSRVILVIGAAVFLMGLGAFLAKQLTSSARFPEPSQLGVGDLYSAFGSALDTLQARLLPKRAVVRENQRQYNAVFVGLILEHLSEGQRAFLERTVAGLREYGNAILSIEFWIAALVLAFVYRVMDKKLRL